MEQVTAPSSLAIAVTPKKTPIPSISHPIEFSGRRDASTYPITGNIANESTKPMSPSGSSPAPGRADRGVEEREREPDREADQREPGQDPREKEVMAARRIREMSMFLQHGGMFAGREAPTQGGRPSASTRVYTPPLRGCQHASRLTSIGVRSTIR